MLLGHPARAAPASIHLAFNILLAKYHLKLFCNGYYTVTDCSPLNSHSTVRLISYSKFGFIHSVSRSFRLNRAEAAQ